MPLLEAILTKSVAQSAPAALPTQAALWPQTAAPASRRAVCPAEGDDLALPSFAPPAAAMASRQC